MQFSLSMGNFHTAGCFMPGLFTIHPGHLTIHCSIYRKSCVKCRLGEQTLAIGTRGGNFHAKSRQGLVSTYAYQQWGYDASSSTWQGTYWTASGAALFNAFLSLGMEDQILFNEVHSYANAIAQARKAKKPIGDQTICPDTSIIIASGCSANFWFS